MLREEKTDTIELFKSLSEEEKESEKNHSWGNILQTPKLGESFLSWLFRQAWAFDVTPGLLIQGEEEYWAREESIQLGLSKAYFHQWMIAADVLPFDSTCQYTFSKRGLPIDLSHLQLDISKWFDLLTYPNPEKTQLRNFYEYTLRYCPLCWQQKETRYFRIQWRYPFVVVCLDHGVELKSACPSCKNHLFEDSRHQLATITLYKDFSYEWLIQCRSCQQKLYSSNISKANPGLAELQQNILDILLMDKNWANSFGYIFFWQAYQTIKEKQQLRHLEELLKLMEAILKEPPQLPHPNYYSDEFRSEIQRRFDCVTEYFMGYSAKSLSEKTGLTARSIRKLALDLRDRKPMAEVIRNQFGYEGKWGLEMACAELREWEAIKKELPKLSDFPAIKGRIIRNEWVSFGIKTWNDLLRRALGKIRTERESYTPDRKGFEQAKATIRAFHKKHKRKPTAKDKGMNAIRQVIYRKKWPWVKKWNDILREVFGDVNVESQVYDGTEEGLAQAIAHMQKFEETHRRKPKLHDPEMRSISSALGYSRWAELKVKTWADIFFLAFNELPKMRDIYTKDEEGFQRALTVLKAFYETHEKYPKSTDPKMSTIVAGISRGYWHALGIRRWDDLFTLAFGFSSKELKRSKYDGENGLKLAIKEMREFKEKNGREPVYNDKEMNPIRHYATSRKWLKFGVRSWKDIKNRAFGD